MDSFYFSVKYLHVAAVVLSLALFTVRAFWSVSGSTQLQKGWVRVVPHVIDTLLLLGGITLAAMLGPEQPWILVKIILLLVYIGFGTVAIKRGRTARTRFIAAVIAVLVFAYIVGVAFSKHPSSWFFWDDFGQVWDFLRYKLS